MEVRSSLEFNHKIKLDTCTDGETSRNKNISTGRDVDN